MQPADGLLEWTDGVKQTASPGEAPLVTLEQKQGAHLWVIRDNDVVHAPERCAYGLALESKVIKHTNLTGSANAYSGGEILFLTNGQVVINGDSGRYGPRNAAEMDAVAKAFSDSGYGVWSMGYDDEAKKPTPFVGTFPTWMP